MKGMTEKEITELCDSRKAKGFKIPPYWTAEIYGFGYWIRKYSRYPDFLPLCIYTDHGPPLLGTPLRQELESDAPGLFTHSPLYAKEWKKITKKDCYVLYSPFVFCRRRKNIHKLKKAKGTLAFPAHTTISIEDRSNVKAYIEKLLRLPKKFQPVSVCLYYDDIKKGKHRIYQKYGIPIYTAGYYFDYRFTERFYKILRRFKYATSNTAGSYLYYAVEMGIPFFIYGPKEKYVNKGDPNLPDNIYDLYQRSSLYRKIYRMFSSLNTSITSKQKNFVEINLGLRNNIGPAATRRVLYKSLLVWLLSVRPALWVLRAVRFVLSK